ncbi:MAG: hypothetical protein Q8Q58_04265 [Candidatus Rokubacteria bacterium]|nr:hypothetical protein [Candidatus Rokubacteria bacterium]
MQRVRFLVAVVALGAFLATSGAITFLGPDVASTPSSFDGQDEDLALWALSEGMLWVLASAVSVSVAVWVSAAAVLARPSACSLLALPQSRRRSSPLW